ncbi:MAG: histidinol-phosphate transaminase [Lachnospiraceae bacterium]|nr:histidinol-phosphate transaminase [Lachnospiraceae bacterium]
MSWESNVRRVIPYVPGEQPKEKDIIKLNTNENPYPPADAVLDVIRNFDTEDLRKYPDPTVSGLRDALSDSYGVPADQIFVGVGSDDVLAMSFMTFFHGDKPILFPDITYSFYDVWANEFEIPFQCKPLREDFTIDPADYLGENGGIVIPNPNAPTGLEAPQEVLEQIVASNPNSVVIIDEAYVDFGGQSMLPLIEKYDNLLVVMTFSKSRSLAGSRIGFAMGSKKLIGYLNDVKYSFNSYTMDRMTMAIGCASLADHKYFLDCCQRIIDTREWTKRELSALGFSFPDSHTNFIFATHEKWQAKQLFEDLKAAGIYVRYFNKPRIDAYLRISIGTMEEMQRLIDFLKQYEQV